MNHLVEIQYMEKMNRECHIQKLDKDRYVEKATGEIKEFLHIKTRKDSYNSLHQTFKKLRYLINNNFEGKGNELHLTLTYAENMTDTKRLHIDFKNFIKRLKYQFRNEALIEYINVVEPQGRGAWHCHVLMRFEGIEKVYLPPKQLAELWGHGFVTIKSLKDVDNIGAYLSAYLTDMELTEQNMLKAMHHELEILTKEVDGKKKNFIKGGRLHLYPPGMNLYRRSKGIEFPEREEMSYKNAKKIVESAEPHYTRMYKIADNDFENTIIYEQYNTKREK
ncbi:hypothetical protein [Bacillus sp. FJAT-22090]|uniref:rolling circle replication-associated protein n=1 Tax=Bacillus sp. FJAT-22090 TaxID=1581038 RepID=UPI0021B43D69|nr:hypothetical protein [Bacillus sp. FJAT-22090]